VVSLTCFPVDMIISEFLIWIWEYLSALSVLSFTANLFLENNFKIKEVNMTNGLKFQNRGVHVGHHG
jgi:hypothetical protein